MYLEALATFTLFIEHVWLKCWILHETQSEQNGVYWGQFSSHLMITLGQHGHERESKHLAYVRIMCVKIRLWFRRFIKSGHTRDSNYVTAYIMLHCALKARGKRVYSPAVLHATVKSEEKQISIVLKGRERHQVATLCFTFISDALELLRGERFKLEYSASSFSYYDNGMVCRETTGTF